MPDLPLFFIIAIQGLDCLLMDKLTSGLLEGVRFQKEQLHLAQQFYADNTTVILKGVRSNITSCMEFFNMFANASGLRCNWVEVTAILLSQDPLPDLT